MPHTVFNDDLPIPAFPHLFIQRAEMQIFASIFIVLPLPCCAFAALASTPADECVYACCRRLALMAVKSVSLSVLRLYSPACWMPKMLSLRSVSPTPRSIRRLPLSASNGIDTHAAHHFLNFVVPGRQQIHQPLAPHFRVQALDQLRTLRGNAPVAFAAWQLRHRWQPSASSALVAIYTASAPSAMALTTSALLRMLPPTTSDTWWRIPLRAAFGLRWPGPAQWGCLRCLGYG